MPKINYVLHRPEEHSEIIFALSHHRHEQIEAIFCGEKQKTFFSDAILNLGITTLFCSTFEDFLKRNKKTHLVVLMDIPANFEKMIELIARADQNGSEMIILLLEINKKYLNMIKKKIEGLQLEALTFSPNKFIGINDKLRQMVEQSYDLNRAGFYAYGQFIRQYQSSLLKTIFRTSEIQVNSLARAYGFTTPPRVKGDNFLTSSARKEKKKEKIQKAQERLENETQKLQQPVQKKVLKKVEVKAEKNLEKKVGKIAKKLKNKIE